MKVCCPLSHFHPPRSGFRVQRVAKVFVCDCGVNFLGYDQPCELKIFNPAAETEGDGVVATLSRLVGPEPPPEFKSDGCTWAPDEIDGVDLSPACRRHDWRYTIGTTEAHRRESDEELRINVLILGGSNAVAGIFFRRVRFWGVSHFAYARREKPGWLFRLWLLVARYWQ